MKKSNRSLLLVVLVVIAVILAARPFSFCWEERVGTRKRHLRPQVTEPRKRPNCDLKN